MNTTKINKAVAQHIVNDIVSLLDTEKADLHNELFNTNYWVIGYYNAEQELKEWDISAFEAIECVKDYEDSNFGEMTTEINSEKIVNMLTYIQGEEVLYDAYNTLSIDNNGELEQSEIDEIVEYLTEEYSL